MGAQMGGREQLEAILPASRGRGSTVYVLSLLLSEIIGRASSGSIFVEILLQVRKSAIREIFHAREIVFRSAKLNEIV